MSVPMLITTGPYVLQIINNFAFIELLYRWNWIGMSISASNTLVCMNGLADVNNIINIYVKKILLTLYVNLYKY